MAGKTVQQVQQARVSERIIEALMGFCRTHVGQSFHAGELHEHIRQHCGQVAPDSAGRILRQLRQSGRVSYRLLNRGSSLYRVEGVH